MSKFSNWFRGGSSTTSGPGPSLGSSSSRSRSKKPGPSPQEALQRLRDTEQMLSKKQEYLENRIGKELDIARKNGTRNKRDHFKFIHFLHTCKKNISKLFQFLWPDL